MKKLVRKKKKSVERKNLVFQKISRKYRLLLNQRVATNKRIMREKQFRSSFKHFKNLPLMKNHNWSMQIIFLEQENKRKLVPASLSCF